MSTDEQVARILAEWRDARDAGEPVDPEDVMAAHPDLAARLRAEFTAVHLLDLALDETTSRPAAKEGPDPRLGTQIGPYRILSVLGVGGMARVYVAEQLEPLRRKVALKILARDVSNPRARARFDVERETLAMMDHPGIATIHDAGVTAGGLPFVVMELVDGTPITEHCQAERLALKQRLRLFAGVCDAIQHANHRGVVHRDIKPSNVLVTVVDGEPVAKVIDFGLAKSLSGAMENPFRTVDGQVLGTPAYMSPEQAVGKGADAQSDVYALGVLLYELITGDLPWGREEGESADFASVLKRIVEEDPPKPSERVSTAITNASNLDQSISGRQSPRRLRGDLDWVTMKALEKSRARRYASAGDLGADVRRHLRQEPVVAGPPSTGYRVKKFVRRHRASVGAASGILLALVLGLVVSLVLYGRSETAREEAVAARQDAEDLTTFMLGDLRAGLEPIGRLDLLEMVALKVLAHYEEQPYRDDPGATRRHMRALLNVGYVLGRQGRLDEALRACRHGVRIAQDLAARYPDRDRHQADLAIATTRLGDVLYAQGELDGALRRHKQSLAIRRRLGAKSPKNQEWRMALAQAVGAVAKVLLAGGDVEGFTRDVQESLNLSRRLADSDPANLQWQNQMARGMQQVAVAFLVQGDLEASLEHLQDALAIVGRLRELRPHDAELQRREAAWHGTAGEVLREMSDIVAAIESKRRAVEGLRQLSVRDPTNAQWRNDLAREQIQVALLLMMGGDYPEALKTVRGSLATQRSRRKLEPGDTEAQRTLAMTHFCIGKIHAARGDEREALRSQVESLSIGEDLAASNPGDLMGRFELINTQTEMGDLAKGRGDSGEARLMYGKALAIIEGLPVESILTTFQQQTACSLYASVGVLAREEGRLDEALDAHRRLSEISRRLAVQMPGYLLWQRNVAVGHEVLAQILLAKGDREAALDSLRKGLGLIEKLARANINNLQLQRDISVHEFLIAKILRGRGEFMEALRRSRRVEQIMARLATAQPDSVQWRNELAAYRNYVRRGEMLAGLRTPISAQDHRSFGYALHEVAKYDRAVEQFKAALRDDDIRADLSGGQLYNAVCAASLAAANTDDAEKATTWKELALTWLREDLERRAAVLRSVRAQGDAAKGKAVEAWWKGHLQHARVNDPDLAILRGTPEFDALIKEMSAAGEADTKSREPVGAGK